MQLRCTGLFILNLYPEFSYSFWPVSTIDFLVLCALLLGFKYNLILRSGQFTMAAAAARQVTKFRPLFDRVLVERFAAETKTKSGIMLPEKAIGKVLDATVVAVGPGARNDEGKSIPPSVKTGDRVLLPEYGGTKVEIDNKEYFLFRDTDILGKWEGS